MENIYIIDTPYHLLICSVKTLLAHREGKDTVVIMRDSISQHTRNNARKIFKKVIFHWNRYKILRNLFALKIQQLKIPFLSSKIAVSRELINLFPKDSEIFIFCENNYFGCWLNNAKIKYILVEDALNCLKNSPINSTRVKIYDFIYKLFGISWNRWGTSDYIKYVEVNENKDLQVKCKKIVEINREQLFQKLSNEQIEYIAQIFNYHPLKQVGGENKTLLLTQPLSEDEIVSHNTKIKIYKYLDKQYTIGTLYIKMHPREKEDYSKFFPNAIVLGNPQIPFELYQLKENFHFNRAITTFSAAIDSVLCADEKISMGIEWVKKFQQNKKLHDII